MANIEDTTKGPTRNFGYHRGYNKRANTQLWLPQRLQQKGQHATLVNTEATTKGPT